MKSTYTCQNKNILNVKMVIEMLDFVSQIFSYYMFCSSLLINFSPPQYLLPAYHNQEGEIFIITTIKIMNTYTTNPRVYSCQSLRLYRAHEYRLPSFTRNSIADIRSRVFIHTYIYIYISITINTTTLPF